jgi:hypothetical protein
MCHGSSDGAGHHGGFTVHDSVKSVDGVGGVVYSPTISIGLHQAVATLDDVSVAGLVLALDVACHLVLDVVRVTVLGMGVVVGVDCGDLSDGGGGKSRGHKGGGAYDTGPGDGYKCGEEDELQETKTALQQVYNSRQQSSYDAVN